MDDQTPPPIAAEADPEYRSRIDAAAVTAEFKLPAVRRFGSLDDSPLFNKQTSLFEEE
jgi:hypothetical protein